MSIQANIDALGQARARLQEHPMCARLEEDQGTVLVIYPEGEFGVPYGGIRGRVGTGGKVAVIVRLLEIMEKDWINSFPGRASA